MDIESDGSERWEDFFGSSTDIGPSVLGYLDTLAENFSEEAKQLVEQSLVNNGTAADSPLLAANSVAGSRVMTKDKVTVGSCATTAAAGRSAGNEATGSIVPKPRRATKAAAAPSPLTKSLSPPRTAGQHRFCWNPSPTVQRLVANELTGAEETQLECSRHAQPAVRKHAPAAAVAGVSCHKNLPLSKSMAKLTHANSEPLFADDGHGEAALSKRHDRQLSPRATDVCRQMDAREDRNGNPANGAAGHDDDDDSGEMQNVSALQRKIRSLTVDLEKTDAEADVPPPQAIVSCDANQEDTLPSTSVVLLRRNSSERIDHSRDEHNTGGGGNAFVDNCVDLSEHRNTVVEARNLSIRNPTPDGTPDRQRRSRQQPGQQPISCSKRRNDSNRKQPPPVCGEALSDGTPNQSTPSLDLAAGSSGYSSKVSLLMVSPGTPVLSSRPLSSSSLCSYSSSTSSSGSEGRLVGGKCSAPSYQASVESLADHSEPEHPLKGGAGPVASSASVLGAVVGLTMCERAVREIIDSESSYVKDLGQVIRGYLEDWKERACLKQDQLKVLFSNIQEIYDFNFKLLNRLHEAKGDPMRISNCFIDLHAEFSCYTSYCTSYPEAISLLTTLLQATHTNALLVSTQKLLKHTLPLGSYLLKPVQRILKYHLLLDNLRKHCSHQQVVLAYELMKQVAHNIDQVKTKLDQHRLVKELAGVLDGWLGPDLSVLGDLLHEGRLLEQGKARFVLLFQTMLIITKPKEDKRLQFRAYIPCKNLMLVEHLPGEPASFNVIPFDDPKGVMKLTARHREEKRLWTQQIKQAMLEHYDIPKRAKELVLLLGDEDERFTDKPYWKRPTNNSPVPEYLERRQQFRRSEMRMRSKKNLLKKDSATSLGGAVGSQQPRGALSTPSFRSYSSEFECAPAGHEATTVVTGGEQPTVATKGKAPDECKCDAVKKQLQEEIKHHRPEKGSKGGPIKPPRHRTDSVNVEEEEEELLLLKSLNERRKLTNPMRRNSKVSKESLAVIKAYNSTMIPKRISEMRKRRPKTLTGSSTFYTDLDFTEDATDTASTSSAAPDVLPLCHESETTTPDDDLAKGGPTGRMPQTTTASASPPPSGDVKKLLREHSAPPAVSVAKAMAPGTVRQQQHMKDSEIISKLLLDVEQFNKMFHKQPKKKSSSDTVSLRRHGSVGERKPEPPSTEPPCEEDGNSRVSSAPVAIQRSVSEPAQPEAEPIYESLLRNVHVPYKYAPAALARHSLPCGETGGNVPDSILPPRAGVQSAAAAAAAGTARTRPESDYVTLAYSELGLLQGIAPAEGDHLEAAECGEKERTTAGQLLRSSDTNISYHREVVTATEPLRSGTEEEERHAIDGVPSDTRSEIVHSYEEPLPAKALERQGSLSMKGSAGGQKSILQRFISLHTSPTASCGSDSNLLRFPPLHRKLSEPNAGGRSTGEMGSLGHIYKQGSMDLGSRIAHLDYADPRTLFPTQPCTSPATLASAGNVLINRVSMQSVSYNALASGEQQRDSMLASSSSSSDSVCEDQQPVLALSERHDDEDDENCCFYERTVEECLEHDFRDSAVYSGDDNDRRTGAGGHAFYETPSDSFLKPPPPSPQGTFSGHPPPIPAKPSHLGLGRTKYRLESGVAAVQASSDPSAPSINPKPSSSRGWVLQQVRRFQ